jgi:alkanesulfonate monooxygenase SsuD/methylene tetrahydromethanopterin reductase-like flavin-dependent oxidoreductase (luciferase family)
MNTDISPRRVQFALAIIPDASRPQAAVERARQAEAAGFDYLSVQDHPYNPGFLDAWTLLTYLAAATTRIGVYPNVANLPLRPPALLAKAAASLDRLAPGRVALGLGAGHSPQASAMMGGPQRTPGEALAALEEAIGVVRAVWSDAPQVSLAGRHYQLQGLQPGPAPTLPIPIWLGVYGPKALALTGRLADGWSVSLPRVSLPELHERHARIDEAAQAAGRDPRTIRRLLNLPVDARDPSLVGRLAELAVAYRFDLFNILPRDPDAAAIRTLGEEVLPAVQARIAAG